MYRMEGVQNNRAIYVRDSALWEYKDVDENFPELLMLLYVINMFLFRSTSIFLYFSSGVAGGATTGCSCNYVRCSVLWEYKDEE